MVYILRGLHTCEFCHVIKNTGEIRVFNNDKTYAAPTMIYHYIKYHGYIPPKEFILAVKNSSPESKLYTQILSELNITYRETDEESLKMNELRLNMLDETNNRLKDTQKLNELESVLKK